MKILEKELWAVDFDINQENTIKKVVQMIDIFENEIVLLHVLPDDIKNSSFHDLVERSVKGELEKMKSNLLGAGKYKVSVKIVFGNIVESILDEAEAEDANLILVNSGNPEPKEPVRIGLNAQMIIRNARKPVIVINNEPPKEERHILCPVDCSEPSAIALQTAILSAKKLDLKLKVISVFEPITINSARLQKAGVDTKTENEKRLGQFKRELEKFINNFDFLDLTYETLLPQGIPHLEIIKYARDANILYIGSTGKSGLRRLLIGSLTEKVLREVPCTIIVTKYEEVYKLRITTEIDDIDKHYGRGNELVKLGYYDEALAQYKMCLQINDMHLPSINSLGDLYEKLDDKIQAGYYQELSKTILTKLMDKRIEEEVRKHYRLGK
jgi:nucleotide-binding universal stress UspA family protein